jgi:hypothetical protein
MAELKAHFTNCVIWGAERTKSGGVLRWDTITLNFRGLQFRIVQRPNAIQFKPEYRNANIVTTDVYVTDVAPANLSRVEHLLAELAWLLSFATYSDVAYSGYDFQHGTTLGKYWVPTGHLRHYRPTFETADGAAIRSFLQQAWPTFHRFQKRRKLGVVIHYILLADRESQPVEVQLLLSFVALESLKSTFAASKGIPFVSGQFRKVSTPPKPNPTKEPPYTFEQLLRLMLRDVRMGRTALKRLIRMRNTIIHSGIANAKHHTLHRMYDSTQDILREYLLRLWNYHGRFWLYSSPNGAPKHIR